MSLIIPKHYTPKLLPETTEQAIKGLKDYLVIDTEDVLVICPKNDKQFKDFMAGIAMPEYEKYR